MTTAITERQAEKVIPEEGTVTIPRWTSDLATGIDVIDEQHKILFDLARDLQTAFSSGATPQVVDALFTVITNFVYTHFATEEEMLIGDERYEKHCLKHYSLLKRLHDYIVDFHNERTQEIDPGTFLDGWLVDHIRDEDMDGFSRQFDGLELDKYREDDQKAVDEGESRAHARVGHEMILDDEITAFCFNSVTLKNSRVSIVNVSGGGLKIYSELPLAIDDLVVVSSRIGKQFTFKEKMVVRYREGEFYGLEFIAPAEETYRFLTELNGAVADYY